MKVIIHKASSTGHWQVITNAQIKMVIAVIPGEQLYTGLSGVV